MNRRNFLKLGGASVATVATGGLVVHDSIKASKETEPLNAPELDNNGGTPLGIIHAIAGYTHSGKSRELLKRANASARAGKRVLYMTSENLYNHVDIIHPSIDYIVMDDIEDIFFAINHKEYDVVCIDELSLVCVDAVDNVLMSRAKQLNKVFKDLMSHDNEFHITMNVYRPMVNMGDNLALPILYGSSSIVRMDKGKATFIKNRGIIS